MRFFRRHPISGLGFKPVLSVKHESAFGDDDNEEHKTPSKAHDSFAIEGD
jgi:hypothetical protein